MWFVGAVTVAVVSGWASAEVQEPLKVPSAETALFFARQPIAPEGVVLAPLDSIERWLSTKASRAGDTIAFSYYGQTQTAINLRMTLGSTAATLNRAEYTLDAAPRLVGDTVYVPLRFVAEAVGVWVDAVDHRIRLRKPDLNWEGWLAIPPHPQSLEGKMTALAVARAGGKPCRVEEISLAGDAKSGTVVLAQPTGTEGGIGRQLLSFVRDAKGWHFVKAWWWITRGPSTIGVNAAAEG